MARALLALAALAALTMSRAGRAAPAPHPAPGWLLPSGVALPYPTDHVFRGFLGCRNRAGAHRHAAIDLGGVGPEAGLGTPVRAMARSRVTMIGLAEASPKLFGLADHRPGNARRKGHHALPRAQVVPGYGAVYYFTALQGRWRTGNLLVTEALDGPLAGATIRYMHLGAVRPDLAVGSTLEPGDELGLLGGTGVQSAGPHVHIDIAMPSEIPIDVGALLGLRPTARCGAPALRAQLDHALFLVADAVRAASGAEGPPLWRPLAWGGPLGVVMTRADGGTARGSLEAPADPRE